MIIHHFFKKVINFLFTPYNNCIGTKANCSFLSLFVPFKLNKNFAFLVVLLNIFIIFVVYYYNIYKN